MPQLLVPLIGTAVPGLTTATGLTAAGSFLAQGIGVGLSTGLSVLSGALNKQPKPETQKATIRQSVTARSRHYGLTSGGGSLAAIEDEGGNLHQVAVFGEGPFSQYVGWIVDEQEVTLDVNGWAVEDPHDGDSVRIDWRLGTAPQDAFALMIERMPSIWTSAHQLNGLACAHIYQDGVSDERFPSVYKNRFTQLKWVAETSPVLDPRTGTVGFTRNLALHFLDYLKHARGARISAGMIQVPSFSTGADVSDEAMPIKAGGTIPRYHGALTYSFDEAPKAVIERFLLATDGRTWLTPSGKIAFQVGKWVAPTVRITDAHIRAHSLRRGAGPFAEKNEIILRYTNVDVRYSSATADPWRNEDSISLYGLRTASPEAYEIQHHNHARRIAKILEHRANPNWIGDIKTDLYGMLAWGDEEGKTRWIEVAIDLLDIDESFEVLAIGLDRESMSVVMTIASFGPEAYAFNPEAEEGTAPAIPLELEPDEIEPPDWVDIDVEERTISQVTSTDNVWNPVTGENEPTETTSNVTVYVLVISWSAATRRGLKPVVQYGISGSGAWRDVTAATGATAVETPPVARGATYSARVKFVTIAGTPTGYTDAADETVPG